jgi:hypothetical protein
MLMVLFLSVAEGVKWLRSRSGRSSAKAELPPPLEEPILLKEKIRRDPISK